LIFTTQSDIGNEMVNCEIWDGCKWDERW